MENRFPMGNNKHRFLWKYQTRPGKREISADEVLESLNNVDEIIQEIEDILK